MKKISLFENNLNLNKSIKVKINNNEFKISLSGKKKLSNIAKKDKS